MSSKYLAREPPEGKQRDVLTVSPALRRVFIVTSGEAANILDGSAHDLYLDVLRDLLKDQIKDSLPGGSFKLAYCTSSLQKQGFPTWDWLLAKRRARSPGGELLAGTEWAAPSGPQEPVSLGVRQRPLQGGPSLGRPWRQ